MTSVSQIHESNTLELCFPSDICLVVTLRRKDSDPWPQHKRSSSRNWKRFSRNWNAQFVLILAYLRSSLVSTVTSSVPGAEGMSKSVQHAEKDFQPLETSLPKISLSSTLKVAALQRKDANFYAGKGMTWKPMKSIVPTGMPIISNISLVDVTLTVYTVTLFDNFFH